MAEKVKFKTKGGETVSFTARSGKGRRKRKLSAYNRFVSKCSKKYIRQGKSPTAAFRAAARDWHKR